MSSPAAPAPRPVRRAARPSLSAAVFRLTAAALVAAVLVWSVLFADTLLEHREGGTARSLNGEPSSDRSARAPAPVTTRTS